jgi:hypothetical protein
MYDTYYVYRANGELIGSVSATSAAEAVFRLVGGTYGRAGFYAETDTNRRARNAANQLAHFRG